MTRDEAWKIVCEFVQSESLRRHMLGVEACMTAYAEKYGEDREQWAVTALLHDFDWEMHPAAPDHPMKGEPILAERGVDEETRRAILSHANYSGVPRVSLRERALFACDELTGFVVACCLVRPDGIHGLKPSSVKKKLKDKSFAAKVDRNEVRAGVEMLGVPLDDHIQLVIDALVPHAEALGINGQGGAPSTGAGQRRSAGPD